jgi:hypothetical protein
MTTLYHHHGLGGVEAKVIKETPLMEEGNGSLLRITNKRKKSLAEL